MKAACVICSDYFDDRNPVSAVSCGHVYHSTCLQTWMNRSRTCPQCRLHFTPANVKKLYFNFLPECVETPRVENEVQNLKAQMRAKDIELSSNKKQKDELQKLVKDLEETIKDLLQTLDKKEKECSELKAGLLLKSKLISDLEINNSVMAQILNAEIITR